MSKELTHKLKEALAKRGLDLKIGQVYDLLAEVKGHKNHRAAISSDVKRVYKPMEDIIEDTPNILNVNEKDEALKRFELTYVRPAVLNITLGVSAKDAEEALALADDYYDNNKGYFRDSGQDWAFTYAMGRGEISDILCILGGDEDPVVHLETEVGFTAFTNKEGIKNHNLGELQEHIYKGDK